MRFVLGRCCLNSFSAKLEADNQGHALQEQLRKLELELEKLRAENQLLQESEAKAKEALSLQVGRNASLQQELEEAKANIAELQRASMLTLISYALQIKWTCWKVTTRSA